jgi:hypothetical protein
MDKLRSRLADTYPNREEGDMDVFNIVDKYRVSDTQARRMIKTLGRNTNITGFIHLYVLDKNRNRPILVLRKVKK